MRHILVLLVLMLALSACERQIEPPQESQPQEDQARSFQSEYGFSFSYPSGWKVVDKDLPNQWAMMRGQDTLLFTVNEAASNDLLTLGIVQAQRDIDSNATEQEMEQLAQIVGIAEFNGLQWYTYAIGFEDKGIDTIVSGTICLGKELNLVMVSSQQDYERNRKDYLSILESFSC